MSSGIYSILNNVNGKQYIGQAYDCRQREIQHFSDLRCGRHYNPHLQRSFNKYGEEMFSFEVLTYCEKSELNDLEKFYIEKFKTNNPQLGYNETSGGDNPPIFFGEENNRYRQDVWACEEDICNHYLNNYSVEQIAKKFNGSNILIRSILKKNNIPTRNHSEANKRLDVWECEKTICDYYVENKWTLNKISEKFGTSPSVIRNILVMNDIPIRSISGPIRRWDIWEQEEMICSKYKDGDSLIQLSEAYNCCPATIKKILKKNNIPIFSGSERMKEKYGSLTAWSEEDVICDYYLKDNLSLNQISEKFNVSRYVIQKILVKNNIPIRNSKNIQKVNGVVHVYKKRYNGKYRWKYVYNENGKKREITSVNPQKLKEKVLSKGFDWIILDEKQAKENNLI